MRDTDQPKEEWGLSLHCPILHSRKAKQVELKKVHFIFIVYNPGLQTRWFGDLVCPLCVYYPSAIINRKPPFTTE